jgi:hypothetical protein
MLLIFENSFSALRKKKININEYFFLFLFSPTAKRNQMEVEGGKHKHGGKSRRRGTSPTVKRKSPKRKASPKRKK